ncbi:MAG: UDP-4-amino-4,6-dideoxy-N-acetyl-beta-L-altrosamine transaminase [Myxococcota bacterium]|nr:UDP-4-amino-4,6-dideoxy-N-acetyl-beta-L-altrosamine transaminase [Myxococcota bacterium]
MDIKLPYGRQSIDQSDIDEVIGVLKSDFLTTGPKINDFEKALADQCQARYAVAVSSGTAALHLAYAAAGLGPGDEIITSPLTFAATANAALMLGANVKFCDVDPVSMNLDAQQVKNHIHEKTKVIAPVDFAGLAADMESFRKLAAPYNTILVEDAAHALGALKNGQAVGSIADMTTFSFHPVKTITTGEGGAITTNSQELYETICNLRNHHMVRDHKKVEAENPPPWHYEIQSVGYNYRLTDIQAALGLSQLKKLPSFLRKRRDIASYYIEQLGTDPRLIMPPVENHQEHGWHLFVLRLRDKTFRRALVEELHRQGILAQVHYIPVNAQPLYRKLGANPENTPIAHKIYEQSLSIPCYPALTEQELQYVVETILKSLDQIGYKR